MSGMKNKRFSEIFERIKQCPGNEHEQGYLRVFLVTAISLYIYVLAAHPQVTFEIRDKASVRQAISFIYPIFLFYAAVFFYWLYKMPVEVPMRRIVSNFVDLLSLSIVMYLSDEWGSVLYPVYLWISIGSAFRFGSPYLYISAIFSILMFAVVVVTTPYWATHLTISVGLLMGLFILPPYLGVLLKQKGDALRKAEKANSYKARFLAAISHELRTPLHSIIALSDLSMKLDSKDNTRSYMIRVNSAARHLLSLIDDILDLSRMENAKLVLNELSFDLREMVSAVHALILPQAEARNLAFRLELDETLPARVFGDELRVRQILINLISNAIKYTESGEVVLYVGVVRLDDVTVRLHFSVKDTGVGIREEDLGRIFQSFVRVRSEGTALAGSGLGLAIAKQLVELMGGELSAASQYGRGSEFSFELDLPLAAEGREVPHPHSLEEEGRGDLSGMRILIADDDALSRYVYRQIFEDRNCHLTIVANGEEALNCLRRQSFDLAVIDNQMPLLNGLEMARIWREEEVGGRMPIIVLTADATLGNDREGNIDLIRTKPITPADLIAEVERFAPAA